MWIFVSEPGRKRARIWTSYGNPWILVHFKHLIHIDLVNKECQIAQGLLRSQMNHICNFHRIISKRQRLTIVTMLYNKDEPVCPLSQSYNPLSLLWNTWTSILTANVQKYRTYFGVEEIIYYPISLFPIGCFLIIKMVQNLIEPILFLFSQL